MYAWGNLKAMTKPCHDAKTAARDGGFGNPIAMPCPQAERLDAVGSISQPSGKGDQMRGAEGHRPGSSGR